MKTVWVCVIALALGSAAFSAQTIVSRYLADSSEVTGQYTLILYGKAGYSDPVTAAFLDREGDNVELIPRAPDWQFTREKGLDAQEALRRAKDFVKDHRDFDRFAIREVSVPGSQYAAIEVKAVYDPTVYGVDADPLWIQYWTENGRDIHFSVSGPAEREIGSGFGIHHRAR